METEERSEETTLEEQPVAEEPVAEEPVTEEPVAKQPEHVKLQVVIPISTNEFLKVLAKLWGETKTETARKLLTGSIQHHYSVNKNRGRL